MMAFVTGGASSGKSAYAEHLCLLLGGDLVYLAAMRPFGEEGVRRIRKHRAQRAGKGFSTIECYERFAAVLDDGRIDGATVLLECLGNVVANELFDKSSSRKGESPADAAGTVVATACAIARRSAHLVIVGNEVGADGVEYPFETRAYQEALGVASCALAARCDRVIECIAGVPVQLKVE